MFAPIKACARSLALSSNVSDLVSSELTPSSYCACDIFPLSSLSSKIPILLITSKLFPLASSTANLVFISNLFVISTISISLAFLNSSFPIS